MVWMTPMLPLSAPPIILPASATQKLGARPTRSKDDMVPMHPSMTTGFLPIRSDTPPQYMPLQASASEKAEMSRPAKKGAFVSVQMWKLETSFQAYGRIEVRAIGSATRTRAVWPCQYRQARGVRMVRSSSVQGAECLPRRPSWAAGKSSSSVAAFWRLVLRFFVRNGILQPGMNLTALPTRSLAVARGGVWDAG